MIQRIYQQHLINTKYLNGKLGKGEPITLVILLLISFNASATEKRLDWSVISQYEHDDNTQLSSSNKQSISGSRIQANANYEISDNINSLLTGLSGFTEKYNRSEYDFDGYSGNLLYRKSLTYNSITIDFNSARESTRSTENDDTGSFSNESSYRDNTTGDISWQHSVSTTGNTIFSINRQETDYESNNFADFTVDAYSLTWQELYSSLNTWRLQTYYSEFDSKLSQTNRADNTISSTTGISLGANHILSERFSIDLSIGRTETDTEFKRTISNVTLESKNDSALTTYDLLINYKLLKGDITFSLSRDIQASGSGSLAEIDRANFAINKKLSEKGLLKTSLDYIKRNEEIDTELNSSSNERDYYSLHMAYERRLTEYWIAELSGIYRTQMFSDNSSNKAKSLIGKLVIRYHPNYLIW